MTLSLIPRYAAGMRAGGLCFAVILLALCSHVVAAVADSPPQPLSTGVLSFPMEQLPEGHPLAPSTRLVATLLTDESKHRTRGSGVVMLKDRWLFFWREANVHNPIDPDSVVKMGELKPGRYELEQIRTIYKEPGGITATDIRVCLMDGGRIGIFASRRDSSDTDGNLKGETLQPCFIYSDDGGETWSSKIFTKFAECSPGFTFNRYPASVGGDDARGFVLYCSGDTSIYAIYTVDNGNTWRQRRAISNKKTGEVSVVRIGNDNRWLMFGRREEDENLIYKSTDMMTWGGPYPTGKFIGANSSTAVYQKGYLTWIARSSPYHFENSDVRAIRVDGKVFEGLVTATAPADQIWAAPTSWPEWSILTYLPVHFDGTFSQYNGDWYLLFGAIEGPCTPGRKYFSRLGIMTSEEGYARQDFLPKPAPGVPALAKRTVRSDAFKNFKEQSAPYGAGSAAGVYRPVAPDRYYVSEASLLSLVASNTGRDLVVSNSTGNYQTVVTCFPGHTLPVGYTLRISIGFSMSQAEGSPLRVGCFDSHGMLPIVGSKGIIGNGTKSTIAPDAGPWTNYEGNLIAMDLSTGVTNAYHRVPGVDSYLVAKAGSGYLYLPVESQTPAGEITGLRPGGKYAMTLEIVNSGNGIWLTVRVAGGPDSAVVAKARFFDAAGSSRFDTLAMGIPGSDAGSQTLTISELGIQAITPTPPKIATQPVSLRSSLGKDVTLNFGADGIPPVAYQWYKDGQLLPGANNRSLAIPGLRAGDRGVYWATAANAHGISRTDSITVGLAESVSLFVQRYGLDPSGNGRPDADPDGDGLSNVMEFALGGDPTRFDQNLTPKLNYASTGVNQELTLQFSRLLDTWPVDTNVEYSSDLRNWTKATEGKDGVLIDTTPSDTGMTEIKVILPFRGRSLFTRLSADY